jgi:hypothetical protein
MEDGREPPCPTDLHQHHLKISLNTPIHPLELMPDPFVI